MKRISSAFATIAAITALLALAAAPAHATFPGVERLIAFQSNRDGNFEIYTMAANGQNETRITNNSASDLSASWSADGTKLAFTSDRDGNYEIYTMNADGSGQTRITNNTASDGSATWSPDGTKIAIDSHRDGNFEIYTMNADGTGQTRITNNPALDIHPSWSPDGTKLAFTSHRDGNSEIYTMNPDGTGQTRITNNAATDDQANWNSRGSLIFYDTDRLGFWTVGKVNATNGSLSTTGDINSTPSAPSPSPAGDSRWVLSLTANGNRDVYLRCDGSCTSLTQLTDDPGVDEFPDFGPLTQHYARPKGATPLYVPFVPAYRACNPNGTPPANATHGGAMNALACVPPTRESSYLTVGTPNYNGAVANNSGSVRLTVKAGNPATPQNEADLKIAVSDTDVRCVGVSGGCSNGALSDYADDLRFSTSFRITDGSNGGVGSGTVVDLPVNFSVPCTTTPSTTIGSTCSINTTVNTLLGPTAITESQRAIWQLTDLVRLYDGGADGVASTTADNTLFQVGGVFIP